MKLVLDASAAIASVVGTSRIAIDPVVAEAILVIAPELYIPEVTNGMWKYIHARVLTVNEASRGLSKALRLIDEYRSVQDLAEEALREAAAYRHPAYDLYYAVLARRENAAILTFDGRLKELCGKMHIPLAAA
jgi:predicted nucleic acid-binding protein